MTGVTQEIAKRGKPTGKPTANDRQVGGDHYQTGGTQHWDMFGPDYLIGYATKYMRWRKKGGVQDLEKAIHVVEKLKEVLTQANQPKYDHATVATWCRDAGLDWIERRIVHMIMFSTGRNDLDDAIEGIRHLIATAPKKEVTLELAKAELSSKPYGTMTTDELRIERAKLIAKVEAAPGWGAAVGQAQEWVNEIDGVLENRRGDQLERRVPRPYRDGKVEKLQETQVDTPSCGDGNFDRRMQRAQEADESHHASLYPWHLSNEQRHSSSRWDLLKDFYVKQGTGGGWRLDCVVAAHGLPKELQGCYDLAAPGCGWRIRITEVPPELRGYYPKLDSELNAVEHSDQPAWRQDMYAWEGDEDAGKYKLRHVHEAWAKD